MRIYRIASIVLLSSIPVAAPACTARPDIDIRIDALVSRMSSRKARPTVADLGRPRPERCATARRRSRGPLGLAHEPPRRRQRAELQRIALHESRLGIPLNLRPTSSTLSHHVPHPVGTIRQLGPGAGPQGLRIAARETASMGFTGPSRPCSTSPAIPAGAHRREPRRRSVLAALSPPPWCAAFREVRWMRPVGGRLRQTLRRLRAAEAP